MVVQTDRQTPNHSDRNSPGSVARPPRKKKRPWFAIVLVIAVVGGAALIAERMMKKRELVSADGGTITVQKSNLMVTVTEGGSIRAHNSIQYKCEVERRGGGEVTILEIVPAGTYITQADVDNGKVLVKLDKSALEDRLIQEQMSLSNEEEGVTAAREAYDIQVLQNESSIANDKLNLRFALLDLQMYLGETLANELVRDVNEMVSLTDRVAPVIAQALADPNIIKGSSAAQELKGLEDAIVTAQGALKNAQATLAGTKELYDSNYVSTLELQQDELTLTNRQFSEQNAHVELNLFKEYKFPKQAEQYLSAYIEAGRELQRTHARCRSQLAQAQAKLNNADMTYKHQDEQVKELVRQIDFCTIKAKAPGLVIYGAGDSGDMFRAMRGRGGGGGGGIIAEGETVFEGQTIISMPDTAAMIAEISVHETEVDKVQPGQPAEIVMDAFPDRTLQGEVIEVAPLPDQQRGFLNPDLKVYKTLVKISGTHDFLKTRMSCKVQILVRRLEDVIRVPIQVVANRRGKKVCYVKTAKGPEEREVTTGAFNDTFTEITEGLEPGEEVLLNPPMFTDGVSDTTESDQERFGGREAPAPSIAPPASRRGAGSIGIPSQASGANPLAGGGAGGGQFTLSDAMIDSIMARIKTDDPDKAKEFETLRKEDPEVFKTKLQEYLKNKMGQLGSGGREGRSGRPRQEGAGGGRGDRTGSGGTRSRPGNDGQSQEDQRP